jgi:formylglycine-generating enzyme required for sulfatase activity
MPWTNVTWAEASAACCAMNAGGACPGAGVVGWRLCGANDWESACEGPTRTCDWSYASNCTTSQPLVCNGKERDSSPAPGDQDAIAATGAFPMCGTQWTGGRVFDLSGNVKEWTSTAVSTGVYQQRGGAYTTLEEGRACDFDFTVASGDFAHPNTGFRCCFY